MTLLDYANAFEVIKWCVMPVVAGGLIAAWRKAFKWVSGSNQRR
jgi:hypothetical protein